MELKKSVTLCQVLLSLGELILMTFFRFVLVIFIIR